MTIYSESVVIVGAGHSGTKTAAGLRRHGWVGGITLVGEEQNPPYDRPPLSKAVLLGAKTPEQGIFFPQAWYEQNEIDLRLSQVVSHIDRADQRIWLKAGESIPYNRLVFATGAGINALRVPGAHLNGVWPLRTPQHATAIATSLGAGGRVVVIGSGIIGLEVAAAAVARGCTVTVLELGEYAMARSLPRIASDALVVEHAQRGVDIRFGAEVERLIGDSHVSAVQLTTGDILECDVVVYGVGVRPNAELAAEAGLAVDNGIRTNAFLQTGDEHIFACGDVCCYDSQRYARPVRLENWRNAEDQADIVARNLLGQKHAYDAVPWFWSNQFDFSLQVAGFPASGGHTEIREIGSARFFISTDEDGVMQGVAAFGAIRDIAGPIKAYRSELAAS